MSKKSRKLVTRFHPTHGSKIFFHENGTVACRTSSFAHSLVFSEKPLQLGEIFLVEIEKTERGWSGNMRLGLTMIDPDSVYDRLPEYAMPDFVRLGNTWIFAIDTKTHLPWVRSEPTADTIDGEGIPFGDKKLITDGINVQTSRGVIPFKALKPNAIDTNCILPTDAGSRIGIMYVPQADSDKAELHFIINGEDQGVYGRDIPYKEGSVYVVIDVYGATKQIRIIQLYRDAPTLQSVCRDAILQYTKKNAVDLLPLPQVLKDYLLHKS
ncbi:neuralized-like protein 2 [Colletes gigas]|uniref:neuralized-like protein 2 n=1 Tax=Colletes gigas TaxID=935657 RepID=UPI001C9AC44D|nr:neuralized-like protein 2 [Colletes gigas]